MEQFTVIKMKTKEERFIELIGDYKIELYSNTFPNIIHILNLNNYWIIEYNKGKSSFVSYVTIWIFFENEFLMHDDEIKIFLSEMFLKYFNLKNIIPYTIRVDLNKNNK